MNLTDTHTHIYLEAFSEDINDTIQRAIEAGVTKMLLPNIDSTTAGNLNSLCLQYPDICYPMMGLHPGSVKENYREELEKVATELATGKYCAVGEIGIDLYWDKTFVEEQKQAFSAQIDLAKKHHLPIVIHARDAFDEIFEIVDAHNDENLTGVFHCFTGNSKQAAHIISYGGFKMGIGGVVTFKNSGLDRVVGDISLEHLVLETDAPYLTPTPYRGKRNEPSYLLLIANKIAEIKNISLETVSRVTTSNAEAIFGV